MNDLLESLNEEQKEAVLHTNGPILIIAGAGTGKTKVITSRIAHIIQEEIAKPEEILALTFTEKASEEMKERLDLVLPYGKSNVDVFTFHSFADMLLRENALHLGLTTEYKVMTTPEEIYFFRQHLFEFPLQYFRPISNPTKFIQAILAYFSRIKDEDTTQESFKKFISDWNEDIKKGKFRQFDMYQTAKEYVAIQEELYHTFVAYEACKKKEAMLTFADLLSLSLQLLREKHTIREAYQRQYKYILVDEFQDTNYTQNELVKLLSETHQNICVCGDDDQSIYKFRGASISNILTFEKQFPQCKKVVLTKNYRSNQNILDASYRLISWNNPDRLEIAAHIDKKLLSFTNVANIPITTKELPTLIDELAFIIDEVKKTKERYSLSYKDFAILIRSNAQAQPIIRELAKEAIPYTYQGNTGLYETNEVRFLLSFIYSLARFEDSINLFNLALSPIYEIRMTALSNAAAIARTHNKPLSYIFRNIETYQDIYDFSQEDKEKITQIITDIDTYLEYSREQNIGTLLLNFIKDKEYMEKGVTHIPDFKIGNVQKFFQRIDKFISITNETTIQAFCNYLDYTREIGDEPMSEEIDTSTDALQLLTIHRSKGLEFHTVFMVDLVDGRFPSRQIRDPIEIPSELIRDILPTGNFHIQEERRLCYVGMTRAKVCLYLLSAKDYYQKTLKKPSQFIYEANGETPSKKIQKRERKEQQPQEKIKGQVNSEILHISASQLEDYATCPLKYHYLYNLHIKWPASHTIHFGVALHTVIQELLKRSYQKNPMPLEEAYSLLDSLWKDEGYISEEHMQNAKELAMQSIKEFLLRIKEFSPFFIEKKFSTPFDSKTFIEGRWDLVTKNTDIIDFKTAYITSEKEALSRVKESMQLKIYTWAYEKTFHALPKSIGIHFVTSNISTSVIPNQKTLEQAEKFIGEIMQKIRAKEFDASPSFLACDYCEFNKICEFTLST